MFRRQTTGSVVCASCGYLVGVKDDKCYNCGRRNPGMYGFGPALRRLGHDAGFVPFMTGLCLVMYVLTLVGGGPINMGGSLFNLLPATGRALNEFGAAGAIPVFFEDRWWTVLTASWLHANALHILFNVAWIRQLAPDVGELYGPGRMIIIYVTAGIVGFAASSCAGYYFAQIPGFPRWLMGSGLTVGASAPIFGLLGALVYYGRRSGSSHIHSQAASMALAMFLFGFVMRGIDNWAHAGGFLGGYLAGRLLDPLKPEQINHIAIGVGLLALTILAIAGSVIHFIVQVHAGNPAFFLIN